MGWPADVDMRSGSRARDGSAECEEGDSISAQEVQQGLALSPVRMKRDIHRIAMVETPAIVYRPLSKNAHW